jgi:nitrate/TMAO reductase-like tetraheme cytochrome c subunit
MQMVVKHNIHVEQPYAEYQQSVHGKALFKDGLVSLAAVCTDCHGVHDIQAKGETDLKPHQPATCGRCHLSEYLVYSQSIHGKAFKMGISDSPVCADCHGEHKIAAPWNPESSVSAFHVTYTCARCHDDVTKMSKYNILTNKVSTFKKSDHGMGKDLGIVSVATCLSCHGFHDIRPASDPESSINVSNLGVTCGKPNCHPNAAPEIFQMRIHVDRMTGEIESLRRIRAAALWSIGALAGLGVAAGFIIFAARRRGVGRTGAR